MRPDLKIGIIVGVLVVVVLMIFFVSRTPPPQSHEDLAPIALIQPEKVDLSPTPLPEEDLIPSLPPVQVPDKEPVTPITENEPVAPDPDVQVIIDEGEPDEGNLQPEVLKVPASALDGPAAVPKPIPVVYEEKPVRYYVVQEGDTLSDISLEYYSSSNYWKEIQQANRHLIKNADELKVGWKLRIPHASELASKNR